MDYRRNFITHNLLEEIKDPKHPFHYLLPPVTIVKWFCGLHIHISFHLPKLLVMDTGQDFVPYCVSKKFFFYFMSVIVCLNVILIALYHFDRWRLHFNKYFILQCECKRYTESKIHTNVNTIYLMIVQNIDIMLQNTANKLI